MTTMIILSLFGGGDLYVNKLDISAWYDSNCISSAKAGTFPFTSYDYTNNSCVILTLKNGKEYRLQHRDSKGFYRDFFLNKGNK